MRRRLWQEYVRYFINNGFGPEAQRRFSPGLIRKSAEFGYLHWPHEVERWVKRRDVLDVGCGMGLHSVGFALSGVRSYTGCDPKVQLDGDVMKNARKGTRESSGWTPCQIMGRLPPPALLARHDCRFARRQEMGRGCAAQCNRAFSRSRPGFGSLRARLRDGGLLVFRHHNFYSWNGHHMVPKKIFAADSDDAEQRKVIDWAHLDGAPEPGSYVATKLNRIRLDELRTITENYYVIEEWDESLSNESEGWLRLTEDVLRRHPGFTRRELGTQSVFCVARRR